jgi:hypothetical protein
MSTVYVNLKILVSVPVVGVHGVRPAVKVVGRVSRCTLVARVFVDVYPVQSPLVPLLPVPMLTVMETYEGSDPVPEGVTPETYRETAVETELVEVTATHFEAVAPGCSPAMLNKALPVCALVPELLFCSVTVPAAQAFAEFDVVWLNTE